MKISRGCAQRSTYPSADAVGSGRVHQWTFRPAVQGRALAGLRGRSDELAVDAHRNTRVDVGTECASHDPFALGLSSY